MNIKRTLKRLIDEYVAALEKQNDLLKENLQQGKGQPPKAAGGLQKGEGTESYR